MSICSYVFCEKFHKWKKSFVKKLTNVNSYMSSHSYVFGKKMLVKKITNKSAYIVKIFTNCNTNTKLFWNENAYKFSISIFLWKLSQSVEQFSPDAQIFTWLNLQTLSKWKFSQVLAFSLWKNSQWK
jgi:hypothetical protein